MGRGSTVSPSRPITRSRVRDLSNAIKKRVRGYRYFALRAVHLVAMVAYKVNPGSVLVTGTPDYEENAIATALFSNRRWPGRVVYLCRDVENSEVYLATAGKALGLPTAGIHVMPMHGLRTLRVVAQTEVIFYTHGLFGSPRPIGRRLHVNVWHGSGPKTIETANLRQTICSAVLATAAREWSAEVIASLRMPATTHLVPGNPRQDLMRFAAPAASLEKLKVSQSRPLVLWMPTYRHWNLTRLGSVADAPPLSGESYAQMVRSMVASARRHDVSLLVKPHPMDADDFQSLGLQTLTSEEIWAAGITMYQLLGHCNALISDYSSVWVDYLQSNRPIALWCPDLEEYERGRGLAAFPPFRDVAGGLIVNSTAEIDAFFRAVSRGVDFRPNARSVCKSRLGVQDYSCVTEAMLDAVVALAASPLSQARGSTLWRG